MALSWATTIQLALHEIHVDFDAGRESIDDTADRHAMAFTKSGERKEIAKCISHLYIDMIKKWGISPILYLVRYDYLPQFSQPPSPQLPSLQPPSLQSPQLPPQPPPASPLMSLAM